jgi:hypothetical protein
MLIPNFHNSIILFESHLSHFNNCNRMGSPSVKVCVLHSFSQQPRSLKSHLTPVKQKEDDDSRDEDKYHSDEGSCNYECPIQYHLED